MSSERPVRTPIAIDPALLAAHPELAVLTLDLPDSDGEPMENEWQYLMSYHQGIMQLLGQPLPQRPAVVRRAEQLPFWELDYDLCQREGLSIIGDPDYVIRELRAQEQTLGCGVIMGLFQFGSMPHNLAVQNIRLFAKEVLPEVQKN